MAVFCSGREKKKKKIEMSKAFYGTEDISMRNVAGELEGAASDHGIL